MLHQGCGDGGLGVIEFVIQGLEAGPDPGGVGLVGSMVGALDATDDQAGEIDQGGEQEFMGVLASSGVGEELVECLGSQGVLQGAAEHDGQGAAVGKALKDFPQEHDSPPCRRR